MKQRIEEAAVFLGVFTRRERIKGKKEWITSTWVIDEKAYAIANSKKLVLLKEVGVPSIGGLQGDYEFIEFEKSEPAELLIKLHAAFASIPPSSRA